MIGTGTVLNVVLIVVGSLIGIAAGHRLSEGPRETVTAILGLFTLVLGAMNVAAMNSSELESAVGSYAMIVVLGALILGALIGSRIGVEKRLELFAVWIRRRTSTSGESSRFVDGVVTATLLFCVGPLSILGAVSDGLGQGADQLYVKAVLDGFAAIAFATTFGWSVLLAAVPVALIQGSLTLVGFLAGDVLSAAQVDALSAVGGVILLALGVRLLGLKQLAVGDMLPGLLLAPVAIALLA